MIKNLTPIDVKKLVATDANIKLIDVRELWEYQLTKLENSQHFPLSEFKNTFTELATDDTLLIYCHHGSRSQYVCNFLLKQGYKNLYNLEGGINAWQNQVQPELKTY